MASLFDDQGIEVDCPECGLEFHRPVMEIRAQPNFKCPACGVEIRGSTFLDSLDDAEELLDDTLDGLGPRSLMNRLPSIRPPSSSLTRRLWMSPST